MKERDIMLNLYYELKRTNALLGFMQTAFAEGSSVIPEDEAADALYHIYINQRNIISQLRGLLEDKAVA